MKTKSIDVCSLCVPCHNHCRYCLLSWNGKVNGINEAASEALADKFRKWLLKERPDLSFLFYFGYSMEHPTLFKTIDYLNSIGSPSAKFLQMDGLAFRNDTELQTLFRGLKAHGVELLDFTFYGSKDYHDRFAGREGDFDLMSRSIVKATEAGLSASVGIPLTQENFSQVDDLREYLSHLGLSRLAFFVPHEEGRGASLEAIRLRKRDIQKMSPETLSKFDQKAYRSEEEWIEAGISEPKERVLTFVLNDETIQSLESNGFAGEIARLENLDDEYHRIVPSFGELVKEFGDPVGERIFSKRGLLLHYERLFIAKNGLTLYDVNDETHSFVRRV